MDNSKDGRRKGALIEFDAEGNYIGLRRSRNVVCVCLLMRRWDQGRRLALVLVLDSLRRHVGSV